MAHQVAAQTTPLPLVLCSYGIELKVDELGNIANEWEDFSNAIVDERECR